MCGRFVQKDLRELADRFNATLRSDLPPRLLSPRFNIAPTAEIGVIGLDRTGQRSVTSMHWGLVPACAADTNGAARMINARSETAADKPSFRESWQKRRAVIPAEGFYEWPQSGDRRQPWYISRLDQRPMAFAALWDIWRGGDDGPLYTCCILTAPANVEMARIHERTPVILTDDTAIDIWLSPTAHSVDRLDLMRAAPPGMLDLRPVSPLVNATRNDGPDLLAPYVPTPSPAMAGGLL